MLQLTEINGVKFFFRPGTYDWNVLEESCGSLYAKHFKPESEELWFDIGANIGGFTCYAAQRGAMVAAFEPIIENAQLLKDNVVLNQLEGRVKLFSAAVTRDGKPIKIYKDFENYGNCSSFREQLGVYDVVESIDADYLNKYTKKCIKIDTEGYEYDILSRLDLDKVDKLVFEFHFWLMLDYGLDERLEIEKRLYDSFPNVATHGDNLYYAWR
jgi:FkbM family methyltransferase